MIVYALLAAVGLWCLGCAAGLTLLYCCAGWECPYCATINVRRDEACRACGLAWRDAWEWAETPTPAGECRVCGCSAGRRCPGGCHLVKPRLCSACDPSYEPARVDSGGGGGLPWGL